MIESFVCIVLSLIVSFLLTLQQVHFAVVVSSKMDNERSTSSVRDSIINGFYRKPKQFLDATILAKLFFFSIFIVSAYSLVFFESQPATDYEGWFLTTAFVIFGALPYLFFSEFLARFVYNYTKKVRRIKPLFPTLTLVYVFFYPWVSLFHHLSDFLFAFFRKRFDKRNHHTNWGEAVFDVSIKGQLEEQSDSGMETERQFIRNVIDFSSTKVKDSMVPRTEIVSVNLATATAGELKEKFSSSGHSRIIVYDEDIDHVVGYIHSLEMFDNQSHWKEHIKDVPYVPETMAAHDLMKDLMQKQKNLAVVVDEFGGTAGIITLEDLVEEIFGEIEDEHDKSSMIERKINDKEFIFAGRMEIDYINEKYNLNLPVSEDYLTLAGYLLFVNQRFPKLNQVIAIGHIAFTILKMSPTKIELVKVVIND